MMRIPTKAMLGKSRLLRVAKEKGVTKALHKDIKTASEAVKRETTVRGIASKRKVTELRTQHFRPNSMKADMAQANAYERGKGKIEAGSRVTQKRYTAMPHQTSNWSSMKKSPTSEGNYLAWKYQGFPKDKSPLSKSKKNY